MQRLLRRAGLYQRVKSSFIYDLYWKMADPRLIQARTAELAFFRELLVGFKRGDRIFDVGANAGYKTDIFLRLGAHVVAIEPDSTNQEILRQRFLVWRRRAKPVTVVKAAVSKTTGRQTLWVEKAGSAKNTLNTKWVDTLAADSARFGEDIRFPDKVVVETITMDDLFRNYGKPFYIKIDVEGHEASVLSGMNTPVPFVSFEVNLPDFVPEAYQCIDALERISPGGSYNYTPDCTRGLASPEWRSQGEIKAALTSCGEPCVEIFWRAPMNAGLS